MSGPQCCENPPTNSGGGGGGHVEEIGGLNSYVTGSLHDSKSAILLVSDIFGYEAPLLRKLADKVAAAGFYVVVPDFFYGDPFVRDKFENPMDWLKDHGVDKGFEDAKPVIDALKSKGISAIGAAGFCWGAKIVVQLAITGHIQASVLLHPTFVTVDDIKCVDSPIAVLGAEMDHMSPPALLKEFEEALKDKPEVDSYVKIFPKAVHGWAVRYDVNDEAALNAAEEAHADLLDWFTKYILCN